MNVVKVMNGTAGRSARVLAGAAGACLAAPLLRTSLRAR